MGPFMALSLLNANEQMRAADGGKLVIVGETGGQEQTVLLADLGAPWRRR
jgi:hypothetical protein